MSESMQSTSEPFAGLAQASLRRRLFALCLDWLAATLVAGLITKEPQVQGWMTLAIFFSQVSLFTALVGGSAGQFLLGIRIVDIDTGVKIGVLPSVVRTLLICLVVPAILSSQGRGLHDRAVRTIAVVSA